MAVYKSRIYCGSINGQNSAVYMYTISWIHMTATAYERLVPVEYMTLDNE